MKRKDSNDFSPNEERFSQVLQQAYLEEPLYDQEKGRPVDYSFMHKQQVHKKSGWKTFSRAAAIVLVFFTAVIGASIWINAQPANAGKFQIQKVFMHIKNGFISNNDDENAEEYIEQNINIFQIDSMEDIDKAKKFMPNLLVPEYIPEGYELEELKITRNLKGDCLAIYKLSNGTERVNINIQEAMDEYAITESLTGGEIIEMEDRTICIWEDDLTDTIGVNMGKSGCGVSISGSVTEEEFLMVAENLN